MPPINSAQTVYLHQVQQELAAAQHGTKGAVIKRAAAQLGLSEASVHRWLKDHMQRDTGRKRRADAGQRDVTEPDLQMISAALLGTFRKTGNRIMTFETAVEMLRSEGVISTTLSAGRLATVLTERGLHPNQMTRPEPAIEQRSLHPNHVWQVDASVCVAYYLSNATGLQVMDEKKFYKNKPGHVTRIQAERLIRYAVADHYEHEVLVRYYLGSECAAHLTDFLIWAMSQKEGHVVHGVPLIVQMDMGSANTSAMTLNLLERLSVRVIVHERHNSRANGSVEKAHHIIEREFESGLLAMTETESAGRLLKAADIINAIILTIDPHATLPQSHEARTRKMLKMVEDSAKVGNGHLLVIEEAHALPVATTKALKRLHEACRIGRKPAMGILLLGQPELKGKLNERRADMREVVQRCEVVELPPLEGNLRDYIAHRVECQGKELARLIDDGGIDELRARLTVQGNDRRAAPISLLYPLAVNNLMTAALNMAAAIGAPRVSREVVRSI